VTAGLFVSGGAPTRYSRAMRSAPCIVAALAVALAACASGPPAGERGERLNAEKRKAAALVAQGNCADALQILEPLSKQVTADPQLYVLLGDAYRGQGDTGRAIANYEAAIRLAYEKHEAHLKLATLLMELDKTGRALTEFEVAARYGDRDTLVQYNYGLALMELGQRDAAAEHLRRACEMAPSNAAFAEALGMALSGADDAEAIAQFERAEMLGASGGSFQNNYGLALQRAGRQASAQRRFQAAVAAAPSREAFRFNLAASLTRTDPGGQATRAAWREMQRDFGDRWSYRVYLCRACTAAGEYDAALAALEQAALARDGGSPGDSVIVDRMPPTLADAFEALALAERGRGALSTALARIERAVALDPRNPSFLNNYGVILAESGRIDDARIQWKKVLDIDPENVVAMDNLARFGP